MKKNRIKKSGLGLEKFKVAKLNNLGIIYGGDDDPDQTIQNSKDSTLPCFMTITQP